MPYIKSEDRLRVLETGIATTVGEMNFLITHEIHQYITNNGLNYQNISDINKVLMNLQQSDGYSFDDEELYLLNRDLVCLNRHTKLTTDDFLVSIQLAQQEFYRTIVAPYENKKAIEHGNISELDSNFFDHIVLDSPRGTYGKLEILDDPDDKLSKLR